MYHFIKDKPVKNRILDIIMGIIISIFLIGGISMNSIAQKIISPLSHSKVYAANHFRELFSFAPGWAFNNINLVEFEGLHTLAYFDVPILEDGSLYREGYGYELFREKAADLLDRAHSHGAKVVLTVTQIDSDATKTFLESNEAQEQAIEEIVTEVVDTDIDGINIDFEYKGNPGAFYKDKFSTFVQKLTREVHAAKAGSQVSISLSGSAIDNSLYDVSTLATTTDKVFVMAYDFAVPEKNNTSTIVVPEYSYKENDYWENFYESVDNLISRVPPDKLVMETAWYGNGKKYPLYNPNSNNVDKAEGVENTLKTPLHPSVVEKMISHLEGRAKVSARKNLPLIAEALKKEGILNENVLAYALATIEHETAGTFEPIEEYGGRKNSRRLGYEGGTNYFGRGFIQLTHSRNYKVVGERIGLGEELVKKPELALRPDISARILAAFFKDNGVATSASNGDFVSARSPINPDYNGWWIANLAYQYLL